MKKIIVLLIVIMTLTGCSVLKELDYAQKLILIRNNLANLNRFKSSGVVELTYKGFTLKKEFVLKKNREAVRFDIINSGIFALLASPFVSGYIGDSIKITDYNNGLFNGIDVQNFPLQAYLDFEKFPEEFLKEIVDNKRLNIGVLVFKFNDLYQLSTVQLDKKVIHLSYDKSKQLKTIELDSTKAEVKLVFDTFETGDYTIKKIN